MTSVFQDPKNIPCVRNFQIHLWVLNEKFALFFYFTLFANIEKQKISEQDCRVLKSLSMSHGCGVENLVFQHMFNKPLPFLLY